MYKAGFITGYLAALATVGAVLVRLAFAPADRWWRR